MTNIPDWLAALGILVPAITGIGGYWLAGRNEEARDQRTAAREVQARRTALAERLDERMHSFQLDLLLELQDVLQRQVRATARVILQDQRTLREHRGLLRLPAEIDQESYDTGVELGRLRVRVLDDALRDELDRFHQFASGLDVSFVILRDLPADEAIQRLEANMRNLTERYIAVNNGLGILVRRELGRSPSVTH